MISLCNAHQWWLQISHRLSQNGQKSVKHTGLFALICGSMTVSFTNHADARDAPNASVPVESTVTADVSYSVIATKSIPGVKRVLDVRISETVSEDVLCSIALELRSQDPQVYERTFIMYYLPGMTVGKGAWATTHFDPTLEVGIHGLTLVEQEELTKKVAPVGKATIGVWLDDSPFAGSRITIFVQNEKVYGLQQYADGSIARMELLEDASPMGRRFVSVEGSRTGDHWIIDERGNLQIRDDQGLIRIASPIPQ